jgi:hypothetical protein
MKRGGGMLHFFIPLIVAAVFLYGALCLVLYVLQGRLIFYPNLPGRELQADPGDIGLPFEPVTLVSRDGVRLNGWYVPARDPKGTLLFFHGNAGNISHRLESLRIFHSLGMTVLIIDYRGYGRSEGKISEEGTYLDAEAAWEFVTRDKKIAPADIVLFGRSLGGAVAAHLAAQTSPGGLILESVFTSVPDLAARHYPIFPVRLLARFSYDTCAALASVSCPVLVIHSPDDEIIPYENGRLLFEAAPKPKYFLEIRGGHNEGFMASGPEYVRGLEKFLARVLPRP